MSRSIRIFLVAAIAGAVGAVAVVASARSRSPARAGAAGAELLRIREADIAFYARRVVADRQGALDRTRLGALLLEQSRYTGDERALIRAESLARESLALRTAHNAGAWRLLVSALLGQHRFTAALEASEQLLAIDPDSPGARATRGEILLELGRYQAADSVFGSLAIRRNDPAVSPRYARWLEIRGHGGEARRLLEQSRDDATRGGASADQLAWFDLRLGDLAFRYGKRVEALDHVERGLAVFPGDWRFLALAARIELARHRAKRAITLGDSSLALHLDPATLATVGDAWLAEGDSAQADSYFKALEGASGTAPSGGFHRAWYLALLDHNQRVPMVLQALTREITARPDAYGWDLLAWARYRAGQIPAAREAIDSALAIGTGDPLILGHARAIREGQ
ncbi:MAG TPA: tetratricopeptide repeat protein [Gemmatimonadales bacterium]|nr:tetratricopeptide repeat protein [Gemmatimonadales bacterium]